MRPRPSWNARFKKASAAKKRKQEGYETKLSVEQVQVLSAKQMDPRSIFERFGFTVRPVGKQYSVRYGQDEIFRSTLKDGHWVHCDHYGNGIGDNIAMVRHLNDEMSFSDAVFELYGSPSFSPKPTPDPKKLRPTLPICDIQSQVNGREYLIKRGISPATIEHAEKTGFISYTLDGVLTIGRDEENEIRAITRRTFDDNVEVPRRDLKNSNKIEFPPVLEGDPKWIVVVEGGIDALAAHDIAKKNGEEPPTVIVSGSAEAQGFLEQPRIQDLLKSAEMVTVAYENDPELIVREKTDKSHDRQFNRIKQIAPGATVQKWRPSRGCKDIADQNKIIPGLEEKKGYEREQQERQEEIKVQPSRNIRPRRL